MPSKAKPGSRRPRNAGARRSARRRPAGPRRVGGALTMCVKRTHNAGDVARGAADQGHSFGFAPASLLDWSSFSSLYGQFQVRSVKVHFVLRTEYDSTPSYPTFWVHHDLVAAGPPATISDAMVKTGVRALGFNAMRNYHCFAYVPRVWTGGPTNFSVQLGAREAWCPTAAALIPNFTPVSFWGSSYNTTVGSPIINLIWEAVLEFRYPV